MRRFPLVFVLFLTELLAFAAENPRPQWLGNEPLIIAGNWDSTPIFRRRVGGIAPEFDEEYARQHSEEAVRKLKLTDKK